MFKEIKAFVDAFDVNNGSDVDGDIERQLRVSTGNQDIGEVFKVIKALKSNVSNIVHEQISSVLL